MRAHDPLVTIVYTHDGYIGGDERRIMMHSEDRTTLFPSAIRETGERAPSKFQGPLSGLRSMFTGIPVILRVQTVVFLSLHLTPG